MNGNLKWLMSPIHKSGKSSDPANYRPTILTNPPDFPGLSRILAFNPELPISALKILRNPPHLGLWLFLAR